MFTLDENGEVVMENAADKGRKMNELGRKAAANKTLMKLGKAGADSVPAQFGIKVGKAIGNSKVAKEYGARGNPLSATELKEAEQGFRLATSANCKKLMEYNIDKVANERFKDPKDVKDMIGFMKNSYHFVKSFDERKMELSHLTPAIIIRGSSATAGPMKTVMSFAIPALNKELAKKNCRLIRAKTDKNLYNVEYIGKAAKESVDAWEAEQEWEAAQEKMNSDDAANAWKDNQTRLSASAGVAGYSAGRSLVHGGGAGGVAGSLAGSAAGYMVNTVIDNAIAGGINKKAHKKAVKGLVLDDKTWPVFKKGITSTQSIVRNIIPKAIKDGLNATPFMTADEKNTAVYAKYFIVLTSYNETKVKKTLMCPLLKIKANLLVGGNREMLTIIRMIRNTANEQLKAKHIPCRVIQTDYNGCVLGIQYYPKNAAVKESVIIDDAALELFGFNKKLQEPQHKDVSKETLAAVKKDVRQWYSSILKSPKFSSHIQRIYKSQNTDDNICEDTDEDMSVSDIKSYFRLTFEEEKYCLVCVVCDGGQYMRSESCWINEQIADLGQKKYSELFTSIDFGDGDEGAVYFNF